MKVKMVEGIHGLREFDPDWDSDDYPAITKEDEEFAKDVFDFIQSFVDMNETISENFPSRKALEIHFNEHCMSSSNKKSRTSDVLYDFTNIDKYRLYENKILKEVLSTESIIYTLLDREEILSNFRELFEGNKSILFGLPCGFTNSKGHVMIGFNSFATDKTRNYTKGNTINFIVISGNRRDTLTLYPLDAHKVESKFNHHIEKYNNEVDTTFKINND